MLMATHRRVYADLHLKNPRASMQQVHKNSETGEAVVTAEAAQDVSDAMTVLHMVLVDFIYVCLHCSHVAHSYGQPKAEVCTSGCAVSYGYTQLPHPPSFTVQASASSNISMKLMSVRTCKTSSTLRPMQFSVRKQQLASGHPLGGRAFTVPTPPMPLQPQHASKAISPCLSHGPAPTSASTTPTGTHAPSWTRPESASTPSSTMHVESATMTAPRTSFVPGPTVELTAPTTPN